MLYAEEEWVVYRVKSGRLNAISRNRWKGWSPRALERMGVVLVAEGLNETQAVQFASLAKEAEE